MTIEPHKMVKIHYTLKDDAGTVIDTSEGKEPLGFMAGVGALIPGLEKELEGKKAGDKFSCTVEPALGYGEYEENLVQEVDRSQFDGMEGLEIKVGQKFQASTGGGPILVTVTKITEDKITVDANHELAGKNLHFDVEVVDVQDATAEDAFNALRIKYEVDESLDRYEAMNFLQESCNVYPPIAVKAMRFTYDNRKGEFLEKYGLTADLTAEEAFYKLREKYSIDQELSDEEARKIFCVREEIKNTGYNKFRSSTIAKDVSSETVALVEELGTTTLRGVEIASQSVRTYPNGRLLSHVIGYMGSISDSQYDEYVNEKGYRSSDLIGKDGIEAYFEDTLRGTDGVKTILVNSSGDYIDTISDEAPQAGQDVYLTIDMDLQEVAEDALERCIKAVQTGSIFESKYGNKKLGEYKNCKSGATVVVDVDSGEVLAMASYPDYDPNIFAQGISTEDWASVQSTNPRDPLAPTPLYNNATMTSVQPGSTFKPVTAIAALECGLDPNRKIRDGGYIEIGGIKFGCSNWNNYRSTHGVETLVTGIQNSCNYFFYCIASGKDWNTGASLNYKEKITIEKIMSVAKEFGLGEKSGVELHEAITELASKEKKLSTSKYSLWSALYYNAEKYWPEKTTKDDEKLREEVSEIVSWMDENPNRTEIILRLQERTTVLSSKIDTLADLCKYSYFNMAQWTIGDEFNISIGQGDNAYTPIQMARYIATLGNGGKLNKLTVLKGIEGEGLNKKEASYQVQVEQDDVDVVLEGMRRVVTNGTLASTFSGFPIQVAGKTGTAQKDGKINPKDEVAYVKEHLSQLSSDITWKKLKKKMEELMKEDPDKYPNENSCVDKALIELSNKKITQTMINQWKEDYDNFAWTVTLAPASNPKIAVVTLLIQGGYSYNAAVVNRELIGAYFNADEDVNEVNLDSKLN